MNLNTLLGDLPMDGTAPYTPILRLESLPVDKPAPTPYGQSHKGFIVADGRAYIDEKIATELVDAARELREWLSAPNSSLSAPINSMITATLETRLNRAIASMETSIRHAEKAVEDAEADEESEE
jgi:hypothetical protein